ncbi:MAG: T9SS type A sorting domain-containing protein, partial [Sphingobacteriales bacterium]|nr:T9SS type A sorting domain-containing protein [Sphingobacteriales bacterium]
RTSAYQNTFTLNGVTIYINPTNNYATKASWTNITPSSGKIVVSLSGSYNYLNGFILTENTSGNSNTVNASTVAASVSTLASAQDSVELTVFPNPFRAEVQIRVNNVSSGKVWITVVDQSGRTLKQLTFTKGSGATIQMIPVQELPSGIYFFQVQMAGWRKTIMAVKQQYKND